LGCGSRKVEGWLNIDIADSDFDVDLGSPLPFADSAFEIIVCQQVIEHLDLKTELTPLLRELNRILRIGGVIWLACPDMRKVCESYVNDRGQSLLRARLQRWPNSNLDGMPSQHLINILFHQDGQHKNLFDYEMLAAILEASGFTSIAKESEKNLLEKIEGWPQRNDDEIALYVSARKTQ
jgi:predicted SAM-dependent methyltransferase